MSRTIKNRRVSLLNSTSIDARRLVAGVGALAAATALLPSEALAACADNAATSGTELCDTSPAADSTITYKAAANTDLQITDVTITENTAGAPGIKIDANGFRFDTTFITNGGTATSITQTNAGDAIQIVGNGGDLVVNTKDFDIGPNVYADQVNTISGADDGIDITQSGAAKVDVNIGADTITGADDGIVISHSGTGPINITTDAGSTITGNGVLGRGISVSNGNYDGPLTMNINGTVQSTLDNGISVDTDDATVVINVGSTGTVKTSDSADWAIRIANVDDGNASVSTDGTVTGGVFIQNDNGTAAFDIGAGTVTSSSTTHATVQIDSEQAVTFNTDGGTISATGSKNAVTITGDGNTTVTFSGTGGTISATTGDGINVDTGGAVTGTIAANITAGDDGIVIDESGLFSGGVASVNLTVDGTVTATNGDGINITTDNGLTLTTNKAVSGDPGVVLVDLGAGGILYNANANVSGKQGGIISTEYGSGTTVINVNNSGTVIDGDSDGTKGAGDVGINATGNGLIGGGKGAITVTSDAGTTIKGSQGIVVGNVGTGLLTVNVDGAVTATALNGDAINASSFFGTSSIDITTGAGAITSGSFSGNAIQATSTSGNIHIITGSGTLTATGDTIHADATSGNITVETKGGVVSNFIEDGVDLTTTSGTITVNVDSTSTIDAQGNAIIVDTTTGPINVTVDGAANGDTANIGFGDGVNATSATGVINVSVSSTGSIGGDSEDGIFATVTGATVAGDAIIISNSGAIGTVGNPVDADGIDASLTNASGAGNIKITEAGDIYAAVDGTHATNNGSGDIIILGGADGVTISGGDDGIEALHSGTGDINIDLSGSDIDVIANGGGASGGDGIRAISDATGTGAVTVDGGNGTITATDDGIRAAILNSNILQSNDVNVTSNNTIGAGDDGIDATNNSKLGGVNVTLQSAGAITATDDGIHAVNVNGSAIIGTIHVTTDAGSTIDATNGDGIEAGTSATLGNVTVDNAGDTSGGANGILAYSNGGSDGTVIVNNTGGAHGTGVGSSGINAWSNTNDDIAVNSSGAGSTVSGDLYGIQAKADSTTSSFVTVTVDATAITQTGANTGAGISATITKTSNPADVGVDLSGGASVTSTGDGVLATTAGHGDVNVTVDASTITATDGDGVHASAKQGDVEVDVSGGSTVASTNGDGIDASSTNGGNVLVTVDGTSTVTGDPGIVASAVGNGTVTVITSGTVTGAQEGILATTVDGANLVRVQGGTVTGGTGDGVNASSSNTGPVTVNVTGNATVQSTGADGIGVSSPFGDLVVTTGSATTVTGAVNGINADQTSAGQITITANGVVTGTAGTGILAHTADGPITISTGSKLISGASGIAATADTAENVTVTVGAGGVTTTAGDAVNASSQGGTVSITDNGAINAVGGSGLVGSTNGSGLGIVLVNASVTATGDGVHLDTQNGQASVTTTSLGPIVAGDDGVQVHSSTGDIIIGTHATVTADDDGINAHTNSGHIFIDNYAAVTGDNNNGGAGNGIDAGSNSGTIDITLHATVTGANGIDVGSNSGTINIVDPSYAITGTAGDGIHAGANSSTINIGTSGARLGGAVSGTQDGIDVGTNSGNINVYTGNDVNGTSGDGINASSNTGTIVIDTTVAGKTITAGDDGIHASTNGSATVTVTNTNAITAGDDGIQGHTASGALVITNDGAIDAADEGIRANTSSGGNLTIANTGDIDQNSDGNSGIHASTSGGIVSITNSGDIGTSGDGVNVEGIYARNYGGGTNTVTVTNSGNIWVDTGGNYGIYAGTAGIGAVLIDNSGVIDPPAYGLYGTGGGNVTVNTSANVTGSLVGIHADSFGNNTYTAQVNVTNGATVTGQTGNGIEVFGNAGSANVVVDATASGAISGGADGIHTETAGAGTSLVTVGANVSGGSSGTGDGIEAITADGTNTISVLTGVTVSSTGTGNSSDGIRARSGSGAIGVTTASGTTVTSATDDGIDAQSTNGGAITINSQSNITAGNNGGDDGIGAVTLNGGNISVTQAAGTLITAAGNGIEAQALGGGANSITVNSYGTIANAAGNLAANAGTPQNNESGIWTRNTGTGSTSITTGAGNISAGIGSLDYGIYALAASGPITINAGTGSITSGDDGVHAQNTGAGAINVTTNGSVTSSSADGIDASSSGGAAVNVTSNATVSGNGGDGIRAVQTGGNGAVSVDFDHAVYGVNNGIVAQGAGTGSVTVTDGFPTTVTGDNGDGINASTNGTGLVSVGTGTSFARVTSDVTGSDNGVVATGGGDVQVWLGGHVLGQSADGVHAESTGGGNVLVDTSIFDTDTGETNGIVAITSGAGSATVNTGSYSATYGVGADATGITAIGGTGTGNAGLGVDVEVGYGAVVEAAQGRGIVTSTDADAEVYIDTGAEVLGLGDATHAVVDVTNTSVDGLTYIDNYGTISSESVGTAAYGDLALTAANTNVNPGTADGGVELYNGGSGTIRGTIDTSALTGDSWLYFGNDGTWHTTGGSVFGPGDDEVSNWGLIGTNNAGTATTINFGAGADSFTNNSGGVIIAGEGQAAGSASTLTLSGLETLTNNGKIMFGGTTSGSDNAINDKIVATGTAFGGTGKLYMDANLSGVTQASCATLAAADCLSVGSTSGLNSIVVNDTNAAAVGSSNSGIALVTGSTNGGANFKLDAASEWYNPNLFGGVLDKPGFYLYDLAWDSANGGTTYLISAPNQRAFEVASLGAQAQSVWHLSTSTWFDRQADLRTQLVDGEDKGRPAVWLRLIGDWEHRTKGDTFTVLNKTYTFDTSYSQDTYGAIMGVDFMRSQTGSKGYVFGAQVGYMDSKTEYFGGSSTRSKLDGVVLGLYGTYMNGPLFVDAIFNVNLMNLKYSTTLPGLAGPQKSNVNTYGGQVEAGYKLRINEHAFFEPLISIAYADTSFDVLDLGPSGSVDFPKSESLRGSIGARIGTDGTMGKGMRYNLALTGRVWNEFEGNNHIVIHSPSGPDFLWNDDNGDVFGDVKLTGNLYSNDNKLSAFASVGYQFKSGWHATTANIGVRYRW